MIEFAGRSVDSVNQYKNVLGVYPKGWRLPLTYRRDNVKHEILVRLMGVLPKDMQEGRQRRPRQPGPPDAPPPGEKPPADSPALKFVHHDVKVELAPADAQRLNVFHGEKVLVARNGDTAEATVALRQAVPAGSALLGGRALHGRTVEIRKIT